MDEDESPADCTRCGACCFSDSPRHASVTGDDHRRLGEDAEQLVTWIGNVAFMRLDRVTGARGAPSENGSPLLKCIALTIDPTTGAFACSIYETRPQVCRDLERASSACRGEIANKSDRPRRALVILRA